MDIIGIDLFDQNMSMACAKARLKYSWISLVLIYLIKLWAWCIPKLDSDTHGYQWYWFIWSKCGYGMCQNETLMLMDIIDIDLFDQHMSIPCTKVSLRCSWISVVLIYLIKMWVWRVPKLDSDAHWISLILIYLIKLWVWYVSKLDSDAHEYQWYWFI